MTVAEDHEMDADLITLTDEDGAEHQFAILDVIEVEEHEYAILIPAGGEEDSEESDEAVILRLETDTDGEEILVDIEDDEEWQRVAQVWEEMIDSEDGEGDEE